jgi:hypothetical protein
MCSLTQLSASAVAIEPPLPLNNESLFNYSPATQSFQPVCQYTATMHHRPQVFLPPSSQHFFFKVMDEPTILSGRPKNDISRAIQGGWTDLTLRRYSGTIKQFICFCDKE